MLSMFSLFIAFFYLAIALEGGLHQTVQAALSFLFVPVSYFWRAKPVLSSSLMITLLYLWSTNWLHALPLNLGVTPYLIFLFAAVYGIARYSEWRIFQIIVLVLALVYCIISPIMWETGSARVSYRSFDQAISWILIQWLALFIVLQLGFSERRREQQREADRIAQEKNTLDELQSYQAQERMQIAREIHDILAHSLTLINVQSSAGVMAGKSMPTEYLPAQNEALINIKEISSDALVEVRSIVQALRKSNGKEDGYGIKTMSGIPSQIEKFSKSGLHVKALLPPEENFQKLVEIAPLVTQLAVRRIVDEALTNSLRHQGPGTDVTIKLSSDYEENEILLSIVSFSGGQSVKAFTGSSSGLVGMKERVDNLGGWITFKQDGKSFIVSAGMPIRLHGV